MLIIVADNTNGISKSKNIFHAGAVTKNISKFFTIGFLTFRLKGAGQILSSNLLQPVVIPFSNYSLVPEEKN